MAQINYFLEPILYLVPLYIANNNGPQTDLWSLITWFHLELDSFITTVCRLSRSLNLTILRIIFAYIICTHESLMEYFLKYFP